MVYFKRFAYIAAVLIFCSLNTAAERPCVTLNGVDEYIQGPNAVEVRPETGDFCVTFWAQAETDYAPDATQVTFVGTWSGNINQQGFVMRALAVGGSIRAWMNYDSSNGFQHNPGGTLNDQGWHHHAWTLERATGVSKWYRDGVLIDTENVNGLAGLSVGQAQAFRVGMQPSGINRQFKGSVCDIRIYKGVALSDEEIAAIYSGDYGQTRADNLSLWYPCNEGEGTIIRDWSGNENHGELVADVETAWETQEVFKSYPDHWDSPAGGSVGYTMNAPCCPPASFPEDEFLIDTPEEWAAMDYRPFFHSPAISAGQRVVAPNDEIATARGSWQYVLPTEAGFKPGAVFVSGGEADLSRLDPEVEGEPWIGVENARVYAVFGLPPLPSVLWEQGGIDGLGSYVRAVEGVGEEPCENRDVGAGWHYRYSVMRQFQFTACQSTVWATGQWNPLVNMWEYDPESPEESNWLEIVNYLGGWTLGVDPFPGLFRYRFWSMWQYEQWNSDPEHPFGGQIELRLRLYRFQYDVPVYALKMYRVPVNRVCARTPSPSWLKDLCRPISELYLSQFGFQPGNGFDPNHLAKAVMGYHETPYDTYVSARVQSSDAEDLERGYLFGAPLVGYVFEPDVPFEGNKPVPHFYRRMEGLGPAPEGEPTLADIEADIEVPDEPPPEGEMVSVLVSLPVAASSVDVDFSDLANGESGAGSVAPLVRGGAAVLVVIAFVMRVINVLRRY